LDPDDVHLSFIESLSPLEGRYSSVERIGPGGGSGRFSLVFRAFDEQTRQPVALKFFHPLRTADLYRQQCFQREAELLRQFEGQPDILHIVADIAEIKPTLDIPGVGNYPISLTYHVTKLARSNLEEYIIDGGGDLLQKLEYFRACCRSVQRIHNQFVVHRDLKPGNWLIFDRNEIRLGDFGTARELSGRHAPILPRYREQGEEALFRGDRWYTAPELLFGAEGHPEAFSIGDFYSLGAVLYELLTQQVLFQDVINGRLLGTLYQESLDVRDEELEGWSTNKVKELAANRPLPSIQPIGGRLPAGVEYRINRLYQGLANLDYTRRWQNFDRVFRELNMCTMALTRQEQFRRLVSFRASWR